MRQDIPLQSTWRQIVEGSQTDCSAMISYPDSTLPEAIQGDQEGVSLSVRLRWMCFAIPLYGEYKVCEFLRFNSSVVKKAQVNWHEN